MNAFENEDPVPEPIRIIQPCSEACTCFKGLVGYDWSDFGVCANPASRSHGFPVKMGRECRNYQSSDSIKTS